MSTVGKNTAGYRLQGVVTPTVSCASQYKFYIQASQPVGSGSAADLSGNGNNAVIDSGTTDAAVWANAGVMTTTASAPGTGKGLTINKVNAASPLQWSLSSGQSLLIAMQVNFPTLPTGTASRQFCGDISSVGGVTFLIGEASLAGGGAGRLAVRVRDSSGQNNTYVPTATAPLLVAGQTHTILAYVDGVNKTLTVQVDGVVSSFQNVQSLNGLTGNTISNAAFNFGYYGDQSSTTGTTNAKFSNVHAIVFDTVPVNISNLVQHVNNNIKRPVEKWMIK